MAIDERLLKSIISEVLKEMSNTTSAQAAEAAGSDIVITEIGDAEKGTDPNEVVLGLAPAFGVSQTTNIVGIPHGAIVKEIVA